MQLDSRPVASLAEAASVADRAGWIGLVATEGVWSDPTALFFDRLLATFLGFCGCVLESSFNLHTLFREAISGKMQLPGWRAARMQPLIP